MGKTAVTAIIEHNWQVLVGKKIILDEHFSAENGTSQAEK